MHINVIHLVLIFINLHPILNFYLSLHNKMGYLKVFPVVMTLLFLKSMHANEAGRILHGGEQELMNKYSINQRASTGYNVAFLQGSLAKGPVTPSTPNSNTNIPTTTINNQRAFAIWIPYRTHYKRVQLHHLRPIQAPTIMLQQLIKRHLCVMTT